MENPTYLKRLVLLEFANKNYKAGDYYEDIYAGIYEARPNLKNKYDISIDSLAIDGKVVIKLLIPAETANGFNYGNHLRGISVFLLNEHPDIYRPIVSGRRFFNYIELPESFLIVVDSEIEDANGNGMMKFVWRLLDRHDDAAEKAKYQIRDILTRLEFMDCKRKRA